jgi:hypothetical protein
MARASKTTTSTTINKYHFLFSFLYWSLIQIQSRIASSCLVFSILIQHIQDLNPFLRSVGREGRLSVARSYCGRWDSQAGGRGYSAPCGPVPPVARWVQCPSGPSGPVPTVVPGVQCPCLVLGIRDPGGRVSTALPYWSPSGLGQGGSGPQCRGAQPVLKTNKK